MQHSATAGEEKDMGYIFCIIANVTALSVIAWLGFLVSRGASLWLLVIMAFLSVHFVIPASDIFTCPNCGHMDKVKIFTTYKMKAVQKDEG